jgi:hypothetical protein
MRMSQKSEQFDLAELTAFEQPPDGPKPGDGLRRDHRLAPLTPGFRGAEVSSW